MGYYFMRAVVAVASVCLCTGSPRWRGVADLFWDIIPELSVVSAMRSLNFVTPSVLKRDATQRVMRAVDGARANHRMDSVKKLLLFSIGRSFFFLVGFEAFMIKF